MQDVEMMVKIARSRAEGELIEKMNSAGSLFDFAFRGLGGKANHRFVSTHGIAWLLLSR
jgi:hypothetical protein